MLRFSIFLIGLFWVLSCSNHKDSTTARVTNITESVYASVTIQPDSLYEAYAAVGGILETNLVEEGDEVKIDDPLVQVVNDNPKLNTENARLSLELVRKNYQGNSAVLRSIEEEIKAARLKVANDSVNYCRQKNLWDQQIGSQTEYDSKKLAYELSQNSLTLLNDKYQQTQNELETQLQQAQNNYQTSLTNTRDYEVSSKINGKVYALFKEPGEIVTSRDPLALIGSAKLFIIEMLVDEVDIVKIETGQQAIITLDAYNGQTFEATVSKIFPKKDERSQTFKVEAKFNDPPKVLYPGLAGEANIVVAQKTDALIIPKSYLVNDSLVRTSSGYVEVRLGLQSLDSAEILDGINSETILLKPEK